MARLRYLGAQALFAWALAGTAPGCGTDAMGTDACRKIEQTRCRKAFASCPALGLRGEVGLLECTQVARDRCLHGLAVPDPGPPAVAQCVSAIEQAATCEIVSSPETAPECAFLKPTPGSTDAGVDASSEAGLDAELSTGEGR